VFYYSKASLEFKASMGTLPQSEKNRVNRKN